MPNPLSLSALQRTPMYDKATGLMARQWQEYFILLEQRTGAALAPAIPAQTPGGSATGQILATAAVTGRTEQLGTTLQNVTSAGNFNSLGNVDDTNTDHLTDGTGSPLTGGKRGFVALDLNNRLSGTFRANPVNVSASPTSTTGLSNDGATTAITVGATTQQFGDGTVSYNAGSVDPGSFGTYWIYAIDATFAGGAVSYLSTTSPINTVSGNGIIFFGKITTVGGVAKTGGGYTGGTTSGGGGGRGINQ